MLDNNRIYKCEPLWWFFLCFMQISRQVIPIKKELIQFFLNLLFKKLFISEEPAMPYWKNLHSPFENLMPLGWAGAQWLLPLKPLMAMVSEGFSEWSPLDAETPASRTAVRLIVVVIPVWQLRNKWTGMNAPGVPRNLVDSFWDVYNYWISSGCNIRFLFYRFDSKSWESTNRMAAQ